MNTRRLTKKYKHKSRNKKTRRRGRSGRRVLKGGLPSVSSVSRASSRSSGVVIHRTSGASVRPSSGSVKPSDSAGISKHRDNFNFECFYNKLMNTPVDKLEITLQHNKDMYFKNTTFQTFEPKGAYLNMTGLKFVHYLRFKYNSTRDDETKKKITTIISLFDQCNMSQGVRKNEDLPLIQGKTDKRYFKCYEKLYNDIYKKLFPYGNSECYPVSIAAILPQVLTKIEETDNKSL
jgi:hypothetical protein